MAGIVMCGLPHALAQTAPDPLPVDTMPAPTSQPASDVPSRNPYGDQTQPLTSVPAPKQSASPVVIPPLPGSAPAYSAYEAYAKPANEREKDHDGSAYISLDSWVYPELTRLYSLGYLNTMFLSMRPYTRRSVLHMLEDSQQAILSSKDDQAQDILARLLRELQAEKPVGPSNRALVYGVHQLYDRGVYITGDPLRDSYHLGQTIVNDYGRPYEKGFSNILGGAYLAELGRFSFYARAEYQHAPSAAGYTDTLADSLSALDQIVPTGPNYNQATIPRGPIDSQNPFRIVEGSLSFHVAGHEISGGKNDAWLGPAQGGALAWSNNAEDIYSFRINRVEPLHVPLLSRVLGPLRYDFFYGSLKGHTSPNHPYTHSEMFSFRPTVNFEFAFQRTIIFGGADHSPVTIAKFFHSFFSTAGTDVATKYSRDDPGARFTDFSASYRLPFVRKYATFYVDSIAHDDVTPISAPRRASFRTGLYPSQIPHFRKLDLRVEAVSTDPETSRSFGGQFNYFETIQKQGYTNKGFIMGDWIGREAKGGQIWLTYHASPTERYELEYVDKKNAKDFISQGTTQGSLKFTFVKRFARDYELNYWVQYERWKAPIYLPAQRNDTTIAVQLNYFPKLHLWSR